MKIKKSLGTLLLFALCLDAGAIDNRGITFSQLASDRFTLVENGTPNAILIDEQEDTGVMIAAKNLQNDFERVTGKTADLLFEPGAKRVVIVGTLKSRYIKELVKAKKIDASLLNGKNEKYLMTVVPAPLKGVEEALVIAGSDKRGTIYGIYELSEQIGVSPWYDWADVPVVPQQNLSIVRGSYTAGEPAVKYRGIFLNDEAPCLTGWVKHTMARTMVTIASMHVCLNLFCVYVVILCGLRCGDGVSMRMIRKTARLPMTWELLWVHPIMNLWRVIIRSGRENVKSMVRGIMLPTKK